MCTLRVAAGRFGMLRYAECDEVMLLPSGICTVRLCGVGCEVRC